MSQLPGSQQPAFSIKEKFVPGGTAVAEVSVVASAFQAKIPREEDGHCRYDSNYWLAHLETPV